MNTANDNNGYFDVHRQVLAETGVHSLADIETIKSPRIVARAKAVAREIYGWANGYPTILQNRIDSLSLACSAMCPDSGVDVTVSAVKVAVLLFAIDDIVDGTVVSPRDDEADALLVACRDLALSRGTLDLDAAETGLSQPLSSDVATSWRTIIRAFATYCAELADGENPERYYPFFARMFATAMEGMRFELRARRRFIETSDVPDYDSYLDAGKRSIASPVVYAAVLVALGPPLARDDVDRSADSLDEFALMGGACLRLANDVRSYARELQFEQRPNSVLVLMRTMGLTEREAEAEIVVRADRCLAALPSLSNQLPQDLQEWATGVVQFTTLMRDWYMIRELHEQLLIP
jgi:Terpene synthase family 2, C-terminal metal binding